MASASATVESLISKVLSENNTGDEVVLVSKKALEEAFGSMVGSKTQTPVDEETKPFTDKRKRYSLFPIKDRLPYEFYKKHESVFWSSGELHYEVDAKEYPTLPKRYQDIYKQFLGFFAPGDGLITMQAIQFLKDAIAREAPEEICFLITQLHAELVHAETYGLSITNVIPDLNEQEEVFSAIERLPCVIAKAEFVEKYMYAENESMGLKYLAGAFAEGTFFTALFALIFYMKRKNHFKTFCSANAMIMRDETLHRDYNAAMAKRFGGFTEARAHQLAEEAVNIEIGHLKYILAEPIDSAEADAASGLTLESVTGYVKTLADQVLYLAGVSPLFKANVTLPWMMDIGLPGKENFYEALVTKYSQLSVKDAMAVAVSEDGGVELKKAEDESINNPEDVDF